MVGDGVLKFEAANEWGYQLIPPLATAHVLTRGSSK